MWDNFPLVGAAAEGSRWVCIEAVVVESADEGMLMSNELCLETEKGEACCAPDFLGRFSGMTVQGTGGSAAALAPGSAFTFYFEVPAAGPLSSLRLTRKKPDNPGRREAARLDQD